MLVGVEEGRQQRVRMLADTTAAFTTFVSAACPGVLPAGISACTVTTQPAVGAPGALRWTFTGSLAPGAQLAVGYRVLLDQWGPRLHARDGA